MGSYVTGVRVRFTDFISFFLNVSADFLGLHPDQGAWPGSKWFLSLSANDKFIFSSFFQSAVREQTKILDECKRLCQVPWPYHIPREAL